MKCNFDANKCTIECPKYAMCAYYSIQNQLSEIQSQLNFLYSSIPGMLDKIETINLKANMLDDAFIRYKNNNPEDYIEKEYQ